MRFFLSLLAAVCLLAVSPSAQEMQGADRGTMLTMLDLAAKDVEKNFYDPAMKGLDWKSLTADAKAKVQHAATASEAITAISTLLGKLGDSHTRFIPPMRVNRPLFGFEAKMFGDEARIYSVKPGSAAEQAGLQRGDRIVQIFNYRPERKTFDDAMLYYHLIRPVGEMKVTYQRGSEPPQTVNVVAHVKKGTAVLDLTSSTIISRYIAENSDDERYFWDVIESDIAYLQVPSFEAEEVASGRKLENTKAIVLDLRGNPGGYLSTLASFAGRFETSSGVLEKEVGRKKTETTYIKPHGTTLGAPLFILMDSRSASAAEIFARYFQKKGRAKIIGDASAGRVNGSRFFSEEIGISRVVPFYVQVSVTKVTLEDGEELEQHPVVPDYPCIPSESDLRERKDPCLLKAIALARKATGRSEELSDEVTGQVAGLIASMNQYHDQQLKRPD